MSATKDIIEGMQILSKYQEKDSPFGVSAEHDIIYCGPDLSTLKDSGFTEEDRKKLCELGWHEDEEGDCWIHFT